MHKGEKEVEEIVAKNRVPSTREEIASCTRYRPASSSAEERERTRNPRVGIHPRNIIAGKFMSADALEISVTFNAAIRRNDTARETT